ncbi:MAG: class I SAM-dependent methyltransferase [Anaerolineales bacterium]|nr:class I SAM-dependent methyltransferase [Anaerolineales bacterium]
MTDTNFFQEGSPYLNHPLLTDKRTAKEIDFILSQIDIPPSGRILDVGCGPGRHSIELARRGYRVVGIDPSETMIEAAHSRAEVAGVSPEFRQAYGESFVSQEKFDAAICLFTTFGQINDDKDNSQLIQRVGNILHLGGYFILEVPQREWIEGNLKAHERFGGGSTYTEVTRSYAPDKSIVTEIFDIHSPKRAKSYLLQYRVYNLGEIQKMLSESDFSVPITYGDYSEKALHTDDPFMVVVAQKQAGMIYTSSSLTQNIHISPDQSSKKL